MGTVLEQDTLGQGRGGSTSPRVQLTNHFLEFRKEEIEQSIPDRFQQQVTIHPDRIAIKTGDRVLNYLELNRAANRVAHTILNRRGEKAEAALLLLGYGTGLTCGMLGASKAGKFYVPVDPSYPEARIQYMLEDAEASVILTDEDHLPLARRLAHPGVHLINIDDISPPVPSENPGIIISPDTVAQLIYTSGSTGQPKGVMQNHRNVLHAIRRHTNSRRVCPEDRLSQLHSCTSLSALTDTYSALLNGAALLPFDLKEEGLTALIQWLAGERITIYHSVPTLFRTLIGSLTGEEAFPDLRLIMLVGEVVRKQDLEAYKQHFSDRCVFLCHLGCTEMASFRHYFADKSTEVTGSTVPVGYAVEDIDVLLLDDEGNQVSSGTPGEIVIRSPYLALGYWRKPELTRAAFLPDPEGGDRSIYRTGDLGIMTEDGCLVHLGRKDFQVKVRGHRIEPAEIEAALLGIPGVKETVVIAMDDESGAKQLVAYVVPALPLAPRPRQLRRLLRERVPEHMIPSAFVMLEALPLTPNGKLDRLSLPRPAGSLTELTRDYAAPRDEVETRLVGILERLLGIRPVGITDDFFEIGGNSLQAARLLAEIEREYAKRMPLTVMLEDATVEKLAALLRHPEETLDWSSLVTLQPSGSRPPIFLVHGLGGEVLHFRNLAMRLGPDQPVFGLQAPSTGRQRPPVYTVQEMASHHIEEIIRVQPYGPYYLGGFSAGGLWAFEIAQQLCARGEKVGLLALFDTGCPGYGRLLPVHTRIQRHLAVMARMELGEWLGYLWGRATTIRDRMKPALWKLLHRMVLSGRGLLPDVLDTVQRATQIARVNYLPQPYSGRITLFWAMDHALFPHFDRDPRLGWRDLAAGGLEIVEVPGHHRSIIDEPHVGLLAERLEECLQRSQAEAKVERTQDIHPSASGNGRL